MDITQIKGIGKELNAFLSQFDDCFSRSGSRQNLRAYVNGQLSDLPHKSIEPIALAADMLPRTLQCFLSILPWDHQRLRDKLQWNVADEHAHPSAIGVVDDSGNPKKGAHTAGEMRNLLVYSPVFQRQKWEIFHIKDSKELAKYSAIRTIAPSLSMVQPNT